MNDREFRSYDVCGVRIGALTPSVAASVIVDAAATRSRLEVHLCNAYTLSLVDSDAALRSALARSSLNLPDGAPVAWLGWRHGVRGPVRGPRLVQAVVEQGCERDLKHYFYGGSPGVAEQMVGRLLARNPSFSCVGTESPPFRQITDREFESLVDRLDKSGADVVWVGLGTPKQDYMVPRLAERIRAPVVPVGAAFDYLAGTVTEAPRILHGTGLEWMYRLLSEPRRLWRRYLIGNPKFLYLMTRYKLKGKAQGRTRQQRDAN